MPEPASIHVTFRPAVSEDCRRLWEWRNEQATRESSFSAEYISFEEHERWFTRKLAGPNVRIFIAVNARGREVGYVRFNIVGEEAEISVSIDQDERGKGYGTAAIRGGSNHLLMSGSVRRIIAHIKRDNPTSLVSFQRAGFTLRGHKQIAGVDAYEMIYEGEASDYESTVK